VTSFSPRFVLTIVVVQNVPLLFVIRFTASDYSFGIFRSLYCSNYDGLLVHHHRNVTSLQNESGLSKYLMVHEYQSFLIFSISLFNLLFFPIFHIISLFDLLLLHFYEIFSTIQPTFFLYSLNHFTIQLTFLPYFRVIR
jgi:hypothetical protein